MYLSGTVLNWQGTIYQYSYAVCPASPCLTVIQPVLLGVSTVHGDFAVCMLGYCNNVFTQVSFLYLDPMTSYHPLQHAQAGLASRYFAILALGLLMTPVLLVLSTATR